MDKTKASIGFVLTALIVYAFYRNYQTRVETGQTSELPVKSEISYYTSPNTVSAQDGINDSYVSHPNISQCIRNQKGKFVLYNGQPLNYPMI